VLCYDDKFLKEWFANDVKIKYRACMLIVDNKLFINSQRLRYTYYFI